MKRRHLDILCSDPHDERAHDRLIDRRHALHMMVAGVTLTQVACSSTPTSSGNEPEGGTGDSGSSGACDSQPAGTDVGDVSTFASGTWSLVQTSREPVIVAQDDNGVFAFSAICTHQGCAVDAPNSSGKSTCPCHGSVFDGNGAVVQGPARTPLAHYAVAICNDHVFVDPATTVDASTRAAA
ncbi:MAG: ubiquinol-cytochrome c reductase iron-sulfur subunit [Polyangiaceae bacterium]